MKNTIFKGSGVAIATPMHEDGSINYEEYNRLLEFQIGNHTDAVIVCGTTGESATMTYDEHFDLIKYTIEKVNHRIPVIAGTGSNDTRFAVELSKAAERAGADALLSVTPYYNKTSQRGLIKHYTKIADSVDLPIILYNVPSRTGCNISIDTLKELSKHKNICGLKEANGDISSVAKTIACCGEDIDVYSGNDDQTTAIMSLGGVGVISVFANIMPKQMHELTYAMLENDLVKSRDMQLKYIDLMNTLFCDVNPIPVKEALNMMGFECGECRLPLCSLHRDNYEKLKSCMEKYGLLNKMSK